MTHVMASIALALTLGLLYSAPTRVRIPVLVLGGAVFGTLLGIQIYWLIALFVALSVMLILLTLLNA